MFSIISYDESKTLLLAIPIIKGVIKELWIYSNCT